MRYFFISYSWICNALSGFGNLYLSSKKFPAQSVLENHAQNLFKKSIVSLKPNITILTVFEFKNKKDFNNFKN